MSDLGRILTEELITAQRVSKEIQTHKIGELANVYARSRGSILSADIDEATTTIPLNDVVDFSDEGGIAKINDELISWPPDGVDEENSCLVNVSRGVEGSTPAAHSQGDTVNIYPELSDVFADVWLSDADEDVLEAVPVAAPMAKKLAFGPRERGKGEKVILRAINAQAGGHNLNVVDFAVGGANYAEPSKWLLQGIIFSNNTPEEGFVSWTAGSLIYNGLSYSIKEGETDKKYIYWIFGSSEFIASDEFPSLSNDDCLVGINLNGTFVLSLTGNIVADNITKGFLPGSNNPILNSSFEKGELPLEYYEFNCPGDTPWSANVEKQNVIHNGTVTINDSSLIVKEETDAGFSWQGDWVNETNSSHSGGQAKYAHCVLARKIFDDFNRPGNGLGPNWISLSDNFPVTNFRIIDNVAAVSGVGWTRAGAVYNLELTSEEWCQSEIICKIKHSGHHVLLGIGKTVFYQNELFDLFLGYEAGGVNDGFLFLEFRGTYYGPIGSNCILFLPYNTWHWFKIRISGEKVYAYISTDGVNYQQHLTITVPHPALHLGKAYMYGWVLSPYHRLIEYDDFTITTSKGFSQLQPSVTYALSKGIRGVKIYTFRGPECGRMKVSVNDKEIEGSPFDCYNATPQFQYNIASIKDLDPTTSNTLKIEMSDTNRPDVTFPKIYVDKIELTRDGFITMRKDLGFIPADFTFSHITTQPPETGVITLFRSANSKSGLSRAKWVKDINLLPKRKWIEIKEILSSYDGTNKPILSSFKFLYIPADVPPAYWILNGTNKDGWRLTISNCRFGKKSLYIKNETLTDARAYQIVKVKPHTNYVLSAYYQCRNLSGNGANIKVYKHIGGEVLASTRTIKGTEMASAWHRVTTPAFNTQNLSEIVVQINVGEPNFPTSGEFWCDGVCMNEGTVVQPWDLSFFDYLDMSDHLSSLETELIDRIEFLENDLLKIEADLILIKDELSGIKEDLAKVKSDLLNHTHSHKDLTDVTSDQHHAQIHSLSGPDHTGRLLSAQQVRYFEKRLNQSLFGYFNDVVHFSDCSLTIPPPPSGCKTSFSLLFNSPVYIYDSPENIPPFLTYAMLEVNGEWKVDACVTHHFVESDAIIMLSWIDEGYTTEISIDIYVGIWEAWALFYEANLIVEYWHEPI